MNNLILEKFVFVGGPYNGLDLVPHEIAELQHLNDGRKLKFTIEGMTYVGYAHIKNKSISITFDEKLSVKINN